MIVDVIKYKDLEIEICLSSDLKSVDLDDLGTDLNKHEFGDLIRGLTELYHKMRGEE